MKVIEIASTPTPTIIEETVAVLKRGGLVIYPTETVYGVGVDATNPEAVAKLLAYKSRREGKPLSIAVSDKLMASEYVDINDQAAKIYERFLPGPITVVSRSLGTVAPGVASEFNTLGVRIPDYPLLHKIIGQLGKPITATSANASGKKRPYTTQDIFKSLSKKQLNLIDLVLDAGMLPPNPPSTVIDTTLSTPLTMRQGAFSLDETGGHRSTWHHEFTTASPQETQAIAGKLLLKYWETLKQQGLVIGLTGPLGAGKTVFTKGIAHFLNIDETITSPTYSYVAEYPYLRHAVDGILYHFDMWKIDTVEELKFLDLVALKKPNRVLIIEWWNQVAPLVAELNPETHFLDLLVDIQTTGEKHRTLVVDEWLT